MVRGSICPWSGPGVDGGMQVGGSPPTSHKCLRVVGVGMQHSGQLGGMHRQPLAPLHSSTVGTHPCVLGSPSAPSGPHYPCCAPASALISGALRVPAPTPGRWAYW